MTSKKRGPKPETVAIPGDWKAAVRVALARKPDATTPATKKPKSQKAKRRSK